MGHRFQIFLMSLATFGRILLCTSFAQGLFETPDRDYRNEMERNLLLGDSEHPYFMGFFPTSFEGVDTPHHRTHATLGVTFAAFHESPSTLTVIGTPKLPVKQRSLLDGSEGLNPPSGQNTWASLEGTWKPTDWLFASSTIHGGSQLGGPHGFSDAWYHLQQLYLEARFHKFVLSAGRKPLYWGQSFVAPMLISDNAKSLDLLEVSTLPQRWPSFLRYLGDLKTEIFFSRMNSNREPQHDEFVGWRVGITPFDFFEANAALIYQIGGDGLPNTSASDTFVEIMGARASKGQGIDDTSYVTNRSAGFDFRFNFKNFEWPFSIYSEHHLEDCCGWKNIIFRSYSYLYGGYLRTGKSISDSEWRFEYVKTSTKTFVNTRWPSSFSNDGILITHPIGRDAEGVYLKWSERILPEVECEAVGFWEVRDRRGEYDRFDIRLFRPSFQESEKTFGITPAIKRYFASDAGNIRFSVASFKVLNKENQGGRNPWEWGGLLSFSKTF